MGFSRQEYWSELSWTSSRHLLDSGIELELLTYNLHWQVSSLPLALPRNPQEYRVMSKETAEWPQLWQEKHWLRTWGQNTEQQLQSHRWQGTATSQPRKARYRSDGASSSGFTTVTFPISGKTAAGTFGSSVKWNQCRWRLWKSSITKAADAYRGDALWNSALFLSMGKILLEGSLMLPSWSELKDVVMYVNSFPWFFTWTSSVFALPSSGFLLLLYNRTFPK